MNIADNPIVKGVGAVAGLVVMFAAANSYFATAGDITRLESSIHIGSLKSEIGQLEISRRDAENKMLDAKDPKTALRYKLQADQLRAEQLGKQRRLDELMTGKK